MKININKKDNKIKIRALNKKQIFSKCSINYNSKQSKIEMAKVCEFQFAMILKALVMGQLIYCVNSYCSVKNYIQNGDFENWGGVQIYQNATYAFNYSNWTSHNGWFIKGNGQFSIRTYNNFSCIGLQVYNTNKNYICQNVATQALSYYELGFDIIADGNYNKAQQFVYWNSIMVSHYQHASSNSPSIFKSNSTIVIGTGSDELCFYNMLVGNPVGVRTGLIIDNAKLKKLVQNPQHYSYSLQFIDTANNYKLVINYATAYSVSVFANDFIFIDGNAAFIQSVSKDSIDDTLIYDFSYNSTSIDLQNLPSLTLIFANDLFRTSCLELTYIINDPSQTRDEVTKTAQSIFKGITASLVIIKSVGFSLALMQVITFSNILIIYIFANVSIIPNNVKTALQFAAQVFLGNDIISNIYQFSTTQTLTAFNINLPLSNQLQNYNTKGSTFDVIGLTANAFSLCAQDFVLILFNLFKLFLLFKILQFVAFKYMKFKILFLSLTNILHEILIFQFIQPSTTWMILPGLFFSQLIQFKMQKFADKFNLSFIVTYPIFIILLCFINFIINFQINSIQNKPRNLNSALFKNKSKNKNRRNSQNMKQKQKNEQNLYKKESLQNWLKFCENINMVLIGLIIGIQNMIIFFSTTFLLTFVKIFLTLKMCSFKSWYCNMLTIIIKLIQLFILIIFLFGFIIQNDIQFFQANQIFKYIYQKFCMSLLYLYISGLCLQLTTTLVSNLRTLILFRNKIKAQNVLKNIDSIQSNLIFQKQKNGANNKLLVSSNSHVAFKKKQAAKMNQSKVKSNKISLNINKINYSNFVNNKVADEFFFQPKPIHIKFAMCNDLIESKIRKIRKMK